MLVLWGGGEDVCVSMRVKRAYVYVYMFGGVYVCA